jgi:magnesium chelatase family protein
MSTKVTSIGLKGLEGYRVQVDVQVKSGLESIVIVGLPDASVKESKERVAAALHSIGFPLIDMKVTINLSPAEQKKNGPLFDLAIARPDRYEGTGTLSLSNLLNYTNSSQGTSSR